MLVLGGVRLLVRMRVIVPVAARVAVVIIVPVRVTVRVLVIVAVPRAVIVRMSMLIFVSVRVSVLVLVRVIVIVPVIVLATHHGLPSPAFALGSLRMRCAAIAAPKPLSMFTTTTPEAQLVSIAKSAVKPPSAVP